MRAAVVRPRARTIDIADVRAPLRVRDDVLRERLPGVKHVISMAQP
jgi:hypothetical protein